MPANRTLVFDFTSGEVRTEDATTATEVLTFDALIAGARERDHRLGRGVECHAGDGTRDGGPHNAIAHPLLFLAPPLGRWLHAHTEPIVPTWRTRWSHTLDRVVPPSAITDWIHW